MGKRTFKVLMLGVTLSLSFVAFAEGPDPDHRKTTTEPEIRVATEGFGDISQQQQMINEQVQSLANRLADIIACTRAKEKEDKDFSTTHWYIQDTYFQWSKALQKVTLAPDVTFNAEIFKAALSTELDKRMGDGTAATPTTKELIDRSASFLKEHFVGIKDNAKSFSSARELMREYGPQYVRDIHNRVSVLLSTMPETQKLNCSDLLPSKKNSQAYKFWESPKFKLIGSHKSDTAESRAAAAASELAKLSQEEKAQHSIVKTVGDAGSAVIGGAIKLVTGKDPGAEKREQEAANEKTRKLIDAAVSRAHKSASMCYRGVKNFLAAAGCIRGPYSMPSDRAKLAGPDLLNEGFQRLPGPPRGLPTGYKSLNELPPGSIIVYGGEAGHDDNAKYGHIEMRTTDGYVSDYFSTRARTAPDSDHGPAEGRGRFVIGVYVKPSCGAGQVAEQ